jgi:hypothetical protein
MGYFIETYTIMKIFTKMGVFYSYDIFYTTGEIFLIPT